MSIEILEDIERAPFKHGDEVRVLTNPNSDHTFDEKYVGEVGRIVHFEYGCEYGQSFPAHSMIDVNFRTQR